MWTVEWRTPPPMYRRSLPGPDFLCRGLNWVTERYVMNSLTWKDSCLTASRSVTFSRRANAGTPHESELDVAFSGSA